MDEKTAAYWIEHLRLVPHPEGGFYREVYRSGETVPGAALPSRFGSDRSFCTGIFYLLQRGQHSAWHRIRSDETWHFYFGDALEIFELDEQRPEQLQRTVMGRDVHLGEYLQYTVPWGRWFAARLGPRPGQFGYSLLGCTVSPGFDFRDFELADQTLLSSNFPQLSDPLSG